MTRARAAAETASFGRRGLFKRLGAISTGVLLVHLPGCGYYEAERGEAFAPWDFPDGETRPEFVAAGAAILASSPHNTQPWVFGVSASQIHLWADLQRHLGAMDGLRREMHVGLGCALENLVVAARHLGREPDVQLVPDPTDEALVARVSLTPTEVVPQPLFDAIPRRHTNRGAYGEAPAPPGLEAALRNLVDEPGVELRLLTQPDERRRFREETIEATRAIAADRAMSEDGHRWYRHSHEDITRHRDGVTLDATGNGAVTRFFGKTSGSPDADTSNRYWIDATIGRQTTGSAFGILSTLENTRAAQLRVGRIYQRLHLWATTQGLAMQPLNQMAERQDREEALGLAPRFTQVLTELLGSAVARAQMLFRIGYPWDAALASPRRPLAWVQR